MTIIQKNICFGSSIAQLWKEQDEAVRAIEVGTSNLLQARMQMQEYLDDFDLEKKVEPTYEECYHRKLDAKERCIDVSILETIAVMEKVKSISETVFRVLKRPLISDHTLGKLSVLGYDRDQISFCQCALVEEKDLMEMRLRQIEGRFTRFQEAAKLAKGALKEAQKKDKELQKQSWTAWLFGESSGEDFELVLKEYKTLPADWMVAATQKSLDDLQKFGQIDRYVGFLGALLAKKTYKDYEPPKEEQHHKTDKRVSFHESIPSSPLEVDVRTRKFGKTEEDLGFATTALETALEEVSQESLSWQALNMDDLNDIAPKDNLFTVRLKSLHSTHGQNIRDIHQNLSNFESLSELLTQVIDNLTWRYDPKNTVTSAFQLKYFQQQKDAGFAKYLELQTLLEVCDLASEDYAKALQDFQKTLVDDDTIATMKALRFPIWPLKSCRHVVGVLQVEIQNFVDAKKKLEAAIFALRAKLDLACLAEKKALGVIGKMESFRHCFRREYIHFEQGLEAYKKSKEDAVSSSSLRE